MKIIHFSDHADSNLANLFALADMMFTTGDLSIFDFVLIEDKISAKPCFGVYGNHCVQGYLEKLKIKNVHLKVESFRNWTIGDFQGSLRYKQSGEFQFTEEEAKKMLKRFPRVDILLLHMAPFGLLDTPGDKVHQGSRSVRDYVGRTKPKYIFCGHDNPSANLEYEGIKIFRTHKARIIEI